MSDENPQPQSNQESHEYQIRVQGKLDPRWSSWFNGLAVRLESEDPLITSLTGVIMDQASLRGVLTRIWNLNLSLISVNRLEDGSLPSIQSPVSKLAEGN
jgi:hypothetical protein